MQKRPVSERNSTSTGNTDRERQFLQDLNRYADGNNLFSAKSVKDLPQIFHVIVDGRVCCGVVVFWEAVRELGRDTLRRDFAEIVKSLPVPSAQTDGDRLRQADLAVISYLLPLLPEKFDVAFGQLITEALLKTMHERSESALKTEFPITRFAENIMKLEARQVKQRMGVRKGAPKGARRPKAAAFSKRTFQTKLNQTIREIVRESDSEATCKEASRRLGVGSARSLDRIRKLFGDKRRWRDVVKEALKTQK